MHTLNPSERRGYSSRSVFKNGVDFIPKPDSEGKVGQNLPLPGLPVSGFKGASEHLYLCFATKETADSDQPPVLGRLLREMQRLV